ncbi:UNVERIFIED_ORG: energy-coupling factor transporter ATP-binding protein EcfA2 [Pseudomonas parafulva]|nr:energy-coupling factor transporter ATP-binding protein EcfA2 [Pseudomonas parafulva]
MAFFIERIYFKNRAPFDLLDLTLEAGEIAVLTATNGRGKTTIISHIVDAFHEIAKQAYPNEFAPKAGAYYRTMSTLNSLDVTQPSIFYLRLNLGDSSLDYIDAVGELDEETYNLIPIENKISFATLPKSDNSLKFHNGEQKATRDALGSNIATSFPAYRYEKPGYINEIYNTKIDFGLAETFSGYLANPLEVISGLPSLASWIMDIVLDQQFDPDQTQTIVKQLNTLINYALIGKTKKPVTLGLGMRGRGLTRIKIQDQVTGTTIYPSIFKVSTGEAALMCLFGEIFRQCDKISRGRQIAEISGIVLIDEIDKHLHIKLQKEALPRLLQMFPRVQFITSSHSPFFNMGLADICKERSKIVDLDNFGIYRDPTNNELYLEVYDMLIEENGKFRDSYLELKEKLTDSTLPLIITEGKTDITHLKAAKKKLGIKTEMEFYDIPGDWGDSKLKLLLEQVSKLHQTRKIIGIFDRDAPKIVAEMTALGDIKSYKNNVFGFCLPIPRGREQYSNISIEFFYRDEDLKKEKNGKRLYFDNEVHYISSAQNQAQKNIRVRDNACAEEEYSKKIFDQDVSKLAGAHSKAVFASLIENDDDFSSNIDFSSFQSVFDVIDEILAI